MNDAPFWAGHSTNREKHIDFGNVKNVRFEKKAKITNVKSTDIEKIKNAIAAIGEEYNINIDIFQIGDYLDKEHIDVPIFYRASEENGMYVSRLIINNASNFWHDEDFQDAILNSGFFAGNTVEEFVEHELAHILTFQGCKTEADYYKLEAEIHPLYTNGVSRYNWSMKDGAETIAEAFVKMRKGLKVNNDAAELVEKYVEVWKK